MQSQSENLKKRDPLRHSHTCGRESVCMVEVGSNGSLFQRRGIAPRFYFRILTSISILSAATFLKPYQGQNPDDKVGIKEFWGQFNIKTTTVARLQSHAAIRNPPRTTRVDCSLELACRPNQRGKLRNSQRQELDRKKEGRKVVTSPSTFRCNSEWTTVLLERFKQLLQLKQTMFCVHQQRQTCYVPYFIMPTRRI